MATKRAEAIPGFGRRLQAIIDEQYGTPYQLAKALGDVERFKNRIRAWIAGERMGSDMLHLLCATTGASAQYLLFGDGPMWSGDIRGSADVGEGPLETRLGERLSREIAAHLATDGIAANAVRVDGAQVLRQTALRLAESLRRAIGVAEDVAVIEEHAAALMGLVRDLGGADDATPRYDEPARQDRYLNILLHAENRGRDITQFAQSLRSEISLKEGVDIDPTSIRIRQAKAHPSRGVEQEWQALQALNSSDAKAKPRLHPLDLNLTRASREPVDPTAPLASVERPLSGPLLRRAQQQTQPAPARGPNPQRAEAKRTQSKKRI